MASTGLTSSRLDGERVQCRQLPGPNVYVRQVRETVATQYQRTRITQNLGTFERAGPGSGLVKPSNRRSSTFRSVHAVWFSA